MKYAIALSSLLITAAPLPAQSQEQVSLSPILMYVADRNSADAAAPRIAALIQQKGVAGITVDSADIMLLHGTSCFGSVELQQVMEPFIPKPTSGVLMELKPHLSILTDMCQAMEDLSVTLEEVKDKTTADAASEMLESFVAYMTSCSDKIAELPLPEDEETRMELRMRYLMGIRRSTSRFLQSWAALESRDAGYYQSELLVESLLSVRDVLENMDMQVDPEAIGKVMSAADKFKPLMQQWIAVVSLVRDKDSATVAAIQLHRLQGMLRDMAAENGLSRSFEEDLFLASPELEVLVHIMDRITHYLQEEVQPPCYGSERLQQVLEHED
ncbi:MAG: hypothetical protein Q4F40_00215 [Akkermansia sp.]|nr:hypothetical protein [Akkermansia sp.]